MAPGVLRMQLPIWMPGLGHVNMYGLMDDRGLAVVDPGLPGPSSWKALKNRLASAGYRVKDIHTIVVTHSHPDHFGAAGRIKKEAGAQLIADRAFTTWSLDRRRATLSTLDAERLEQAAIDEAARYRGPSLDELPSLDAHDHAALDEITEETQRLSVPWGGTTPWGGSRHPQPSMSRRFMIRAMRLLFAPPEPSRRVGHGNPIELGGREWIALHTPGHTLDHLCLYDADGGVLLSGDHVLPTITPHIAGSAQGDALSSYLATLDLVAGLGDVRLGLPAHGHPFDDVPGRVDAIKEHHAERMEKLRVGVPRARTGERRGVVPRTVSGEALGRHGRERDLRPPRAPPRVRRGRAVGRSRSLRVSGRRRELTRCQRLLPAGTVQGMAVDLATEATELLRDLIRNACVNTGAPESGEEVRNSDLLTAYLGSAGLDIEHYEPQPGRRSLLAKIEGSDPDAPTLMLMGHTDVVPVNPDGWTRDPFGADLDDGMIWGRGAVDMLNLTSTMAVAFRHLAQSGFTPRGTLLYLGVADEEALGTFGAKYLVEHELDRVSVGLRHHRIRWIPGADRPGAPTAHHGGGEGHVLDEHHGARHAQSRIAGVSDRQRARHCGRGRSTHRRVSARGTDRRYLAALRRGPRPARRPRQS